MTWLLIALFCACAVAVYCAIALSGDESRREERDDRGRS